MDKIEKGKSKMEDDKKNATKDVSKTPNKKDFSPKKFNTIDNSNPNSFPKNVNQFRHILEDIKCCGADIEFMLQLRRYKQIKNLEKANLNEPSFYQDDLTKYRNRITLKPEEKKMLQVNLGQYKYILSDRAKYAINNPTFKYEVRLRTEPTYLSKIYTKTKSPEGEGEGEGEKKQKMNSMLNIKKWDSTSIPPHKSLFNTLLPPILPPSKEVFAKNESRVGRPIIIRKKDGYVNGEKVKSRIFEYNNSLAYRYPSEHYPNSRYSNDYGVGNLGEIRHILDDDNRTMTSNWSSYLRGIKKKNISPDEIKKTEQKLRDKSNQKSVIK